MHLPTLREPAAAWRRALLVVLVWAAVVWAAVVWAAVAARADAQGRQPLPSFGASLEQVEPVAPADVEEDFWLPQGANSWPSTRAMPSEGFPWVWQLMPDGLCWRSYLAGVKEPRFGIVTSDNSSFGTIWDATLGGRVSLVRFGTPNAYRPDGWELQFEGAALPRLWPPTVPSAPLIACDYRVGLPLVYANGPWQFKTGYYHLSAHLGDEYMELNPTVERINYMRDALMMGVGYYYTENLRLFAETDYAFAADGGAEPWEFQFGADWSPAVRGGAPFAAFYGNLFEELNFGGYWVVQAGWQWRGGPSMHTFRIGVQYVNGSSIQGEFYDQFEQQTGFGVWYDY